MRYFIVIAIILSTGIFFWFKKPQVNYPVQIEKSAETENIKIITKDLDTPWGMDFLPNGNLLVTERKGVVSEIATKTGDKISENIVQNVIEEGEGGLLGIAIDPDYKNNQEIYLYYTYEFENDRTANRVSKFKYTDKKLSDEKIIIDNIPGAKFHNGGALKFGPDKNLYITTGDAQDESFSQDTSSLAGKILRVVNESVEIYSYGHRNPQGVAWDGSGQMWATEHGRSGVLSGFDELNKIDQGKNYGWPTIQGDDIKDGMEKPVIHSGANDTWAPTGLAYKNDKLFFGGLRGKALYEYDIVTGVLKEHLKDKFGRIRGVTIGPDNALYFTTSNRDGRGNPNEADDKIVRVVL